MPAALIQRSVQVFVVIGHALLPVGRHPHGFLRHAFVVAEQRPDPLRGCGFAGEPGETLTSGQGQGAQRFDQGSFDVHPPAVASSELPVHYGVLPASKNVCAIPDGRVGKVTILGVGTCAVVASQPGDGGIGWLAAGDVVRDIRIVR